MVGFKYNIKIIVGLGTPETGFANQNSAPKYSGRYRPQSKVNNVYHKGYIWIPKKNMNLCWAWYHQYGICYAK